jgi:hypothetical protein
MSHRDSWQPGEARYANHPDPAVRLLHEKSKALPLRSLERDILTCAILYLEGDLNPGGSVALWWGHEELAT